jgi:hypothetical protein
MALTVIMHHVLRDDAAAQKCRDVSAIGCCAQAARVDRTTVAAGAQRPDASHDRRAWDSREAWEAWHGEAAFRKTRERLDGLQARPSETTWYELIEERRGAPQSRCWSRSSCSASFPPSVSVRNDQGTSRPYMRVGGLRGHLQKDRRPRPVPVSISDRRLR